jgi:hypothetical protein
MPAASLSSFSGRTASLERRRALSAGKSALPAATERVRTGERSAALPTTAGVAAPVSPPLVAKPASEATSAPPPSLGNTSQSGRILSMMRRQQLAGGKKTLQAAQRPPAAPSAAVASSSVAPPAVPPVSVSANKADANCVGSCREQARARRALLSQRGRGAQPAALPSRPPRQGTLQYAPKVTESTTHGGQLVTGSRIGRGTQVTGQEPGALLPISGTQYIGTSDGSPARSGGPKVGLARTAGGAVVSGTLIRSKVRVTGDEPGGTITITGEAEQNAADDMTPRSADSASVSSQFNRQVDPHGHSVFGTNLGRSARSLGSRDRNRQAPIESTENGLSITGSAVGRGGRVTGDEDGACRQVTGNQYLSPARAQAECGGSGGATTPAARSGAPRRDPVTGAKVSIAQTWGQQRLTGTNVEHDPRVTGEAAGSCALITGSPYQGANTVHGWCDPSAAATVEDRLTRRPAVASVTGDVPHHSESITGTGRGAAREVTGSRYYAESPQAPSTELADPVAGLDARFSVSSPQRSAQLRARAQKAQSTNGAGEAGGVAVLSSSPPITGSFAIGRDRVTGNVEFLFQSRSSSDPKATAARLRVTGEGRAAGTPVSGWSWSERSNVTGTEGSTAAERNPSERAGKPQAFSGARRFKALAKHEDTKQLVTGLLGWSGKTAAKVTLTGGAQA